MPKSTDEAVMHQLIAYSHERMSKQNAYPFCAFVVKDDQVIARAFNDVNNFWGDRTTHGEMVALKKVSQAHHSTTAIRGVSVYTTCEPCLACFETIFWSGAKRIIYSVGKTEFTEYFHDHSFDIHQFPKQHPGMIEIVGGVLKEDGIQLFKSAKEKYGW